MKSKWIRAVAGILLLSVSFSIGACQRKRFSIDEFVEISDKNGILQMVNAVGAEEFEIVEMSKGSNDEYTLQYVRYSTADAAKEKFESMRQGYLDLLEDTGSGNEVTLISSDKGGMQRMILNVSVTNEYGQKIGVYAATVLVDDIVIDMAANGNDLRAIEKIDGILKDFGYYY